MLPNTENFSLLAEINTCTGDGYSSCSFTKETDGKITGCECRSGSGSCNHSVSDDGKNPDITDKPKTKI